MSVLRSSTSFQASSGSKAGLTEGIPRATDQIKDRVLRGDSDSAKCLSTIYVYVFFPPPFSFSSRFASVGRLVDDGIHCNTQSFLERKLRATTKLRRLLLQDLSGPDRYFQAFDLQMAFLQLFVVPWTNTVCPMDKTGFRNTPSTAGDSMTDSERPSPEPLLKKEASPAVLGGERILEMLWSLQMH